MAQRKTIDELQSEQIEKVYGWREAAREALEKQRGGPQRPERRKMWVRPAEGYRRVMTADLQEITGPVEVSASDTWIQRRLRDGELEECSAQDAPPEEVNPETEAPPRPRRPVPTPPADAAAPPTEPVEPPPAEPPPPAEELAPPPEPAPPAA